MTLDRTKLITLLSLGEGFTTEFKLAGTTHLGRELCAFANASGKKMVPGEKLPILIKVCC